MTSYRRNYQPGGTYFFTVVLNDRSSKLLFHFAEQLKECIRVEKRIAPFNILAMVIMPDHIHAIWKLPEGDIDYTNRWRRIKTRFSRMLPKDGEAVSASRESKGERGIWQRRFWEHAIRDQEDFNRHLDYVHYNPVKHGLVERVVDWPHSTFHAYVRRGIYSCEWGSKMQNISVLVQSGE